MPQGETVTSADVLAFTAPVSGYLCPLSANTFGIEFLSFKIRDFDSGGTLFEVKKDADAAPVDYSAIEDEDSIRCIRYDFGPEFLKLKMIGTTLEFCVGGQEVNGFRMIERHYLKDKLIKSYDFTFGFCIPNSTNSWEAIYEMPEFTPEELEELVSNPYAIKSDSFYFVEDVLVMHNKAEYSYA